MSTQIKRLKQNGIEFVPITMSEAVVVNSEFINIPGWDTGKITTLDKVLGQYGIFAEDIKNQILAKQDQLTWDTYFHIDDDNQVHIKWGSGFKIDESTGEVNLDFTLYAVVDQLPDPSANCLNKIYIVPLKLTDAQDDSNACAEYICKQVGSEYVWEKFGTLQAETDLTGYVTRTEFEQFASSIQGEIDDIEKELEEISDKLEILDDITENSLTAVNVTYNNQNIIVGYDIPENLYADVANESDHVTNPTT